VKSVPQAVSLFLIFLDGQDEVTIVAVAYAKRRPG
jgi:hypothetical protein